MVDRGGEDWERMTHWLIYLGMSAIDERSAKEREELRRSLWKYCGRDGTKREQLEALRLERALLPSIFLSPKGAEFVDGAVSELGPMIGYLGALLLFSEYELSEGYDRVKEHAGEKVSEDYTYLPTIDELVEDIYEGLHGDVADKFSLGQFERVECLPDIFSEDGVYDMAGVRGGGSVYVPTSSYGEAPIYAFGEGNWRSCLFQGKNQAVLHLVHFVYECHSLDAVFQHQDALEVPPLREGKGGKELRRFDRVLLNLQGEQDLGVMARRKLMQNDEYGRFKDVDIANVSVEYLYMVHALACCDSVGGQLVVTVPQKLLNSIGTEGADRNARRMLFQNSAIPLRTVISLPTFFESKKSKRALLIFDSLSSYAQQEGSVLFVRGEGWFENEQERTDRLQESIRKEGDPSEHDSEAVKVGRSLTRILLNLKQDRSRKNKGLREQWSRRPRCGDFPKGKTAGDVRGVCREVDLAALKNEEYSWEVGRYVPRSWQMRSNEKASRDSYLDICVKARASASKVDENMRALKLQVLKESKGREGQ